MPGDLITVDEARARVLATVRPLADETVAVTDALGRVLTPDAVDQLVFRNHPVRLQEQHREHRSLLPTAERHAASI